MGNSDKSGRRGFLSSVAVAAGAVAVAAPQRALARDLIRIEPLGVDAARQVGRWRIVAVHPVRFGAMPVVLEDAGGDRFQVDVLRRDRDPQHPDGVGNTESLSVYLTNYGDGDLATHEEHGLGAMAFADALATGEVSVPEGLLTFAERAARHATETLSVPLA